MPHQEKEWTIIFLIYADFRKNGTNKLDTDLKREAHRLFNDLRTCALNPKLEILIVLNSITPSPKDKKSFDTTRVLRVRRKAKAKFNEFYKIDEIDTLVAIQKEEVLADIFSKIHNNGYKKLITRGKRYFLNTWDHGSAFGVFRRDFGAGEGKTEKREIHFFKGDNGMSPNFQTILQEKRVPVSLVKRNGIYEKIERFWERPIYKYFSRDNKFLFELNTANDKDAFYHQLITAPRLDAAIKLVNDSGKFSLVVPSVFLQEVMFFDSKINPGIRGIEVKEKKEGLMTFALPDQVTKIRDILTNEELQRVIENGFKDDGNTGETAKIDVLLMMNCSLMNIHTCYALRTNVDYLVAPQGTITEPGYNYKALLKEIVRSLNDQVIDPEELAKLCVHSCGYELSPERMKFSSGIDKWAIGAINLKEYEIVAEFIDRIANSAIEILKESAKDPFGIFGASLCRCTRFDDTDLEYFMIDITHWLSEIVVRLKERQVDSRTFCEDYLYLTEYIDKKILSLRIGPRIYPSSSQKVTRRPYFATIYFPQNIKNITEEFEYFISPQSKYQSYLLRDKKSWLEFLNLK